MNICRFRASLNFVHSISSLRLAIAKIGSKGWCGSPHSTVDHVAGRDQTLARLHGFHEAPMIMTASRHIGGTLIAAVTCTVVGMGARHVEHTGTT